MKEVSANELIKWADAATKELCGTDRFTDRQLYNLIERTRVPYAEEGGYTALLESLLDVIEEELRKRLRTGSSLPTPHSPSTNP